MDNRKVGLLIIGIAALMAFIVLSFNLAMADIVNQSCTHGMSCPMWGSIEFQTNLSIAITVIVGLVGLVLIFSKENTLEDTIEMLNNQKKNGLDREAYEEDMSTMRSDEKKLMESILDEEGTIFQSELVERSGFSKAKVSRVLDRLEGKGLVERKRRGMSNVVILKH